jgi:DNA-binding response OmpR family regulator
MPERRKVVVVEDDPSIAAAIVRALLQAGFDVELATDGQSGVEKGAAANVALIVLDLMLPEIDGIEVLQRLRARTTAPILVVTARTEVSVRVAVFKEGAVDYLPKPFFVEELLARVHARLGGTTNGGDKVAFGPLEIDRNRREVSIDGGHVPLTPTEFLLFEALTRRPGRATSRGELALALTDPDEASPRHLDAHIARLRKKLSIFGASIVTVWGHGYRFDPPAQ